MPDDNDTATLATERKALPIELTAEASSLPAALARLAEELSKLAGLMPDLQDVSFDFDAPAGTVHFRAYAKR